MSNLASLDIGGVSTFPNLLLAPMSGVTNSSFRRLLREENPGAVGLVVTEFISIEGLTRGNLKSQKMLDFEEIERPLSIQIFGHDVDRMVDAAKMAEDAGADIVDINSGCPVPKVVKKGGGCELMRQPLHLGNMLEKVARAINIPLTLKIRSGWDENSINSPEIARIAEEAGVKMLAVHGRTRTDLYRGKADWNIVARIAKERNIPVVGSGDITSGEEAKYALSLGVAGLMIGRGAMENPWVFSEIKSFLEGQPQQRRPHSETMRALLRYLALLTEVCTPNTALGRMKQLIAQSTRGLPGGVFLRRELCSMKDVFLLEDTLKKWQEELLESEAGQRSEPFSWEMLSASREVLSGALFSHEEGSL